MTKLFKKLPAWLTLPRILIGLFLITRLYIWIAQPQSFSEIIYSYMPYAHLWASGTIPYRQQWYEYPPATIPLFYIPHVVDMSTHPYPFHTNYSQNYRFILLLVDCGIFYLVWKSLKKQKVGDGVFVTAILYYIFLTAKAHDFIYDTMDLTFAAGLVITVAAPLLLSGVVASKSVSKSATKPDARVFFNEKLTSFYSWIGFWLATALKYVNAPLAPLYALLERKSLPKLIISCVLAGAVIWGVPAVLYRSSLIVSLVYHQNRGIQIDSVPSIVIRTISRFTKSEQVIEVYKNYEIAGPVTNQFKPFVTLLFVGALAVFLLSMAWCILRRPQIPAHWWRVHITLGYVLVFLFTGKVLSTPFLLWMIPLLALYPFQNRKQQALALLPSFALIFITMSRVPNTELGFLTLPLLVGWIRTIGLGWLLGYWIWLTAQAVKISKAK